MLTLRIASPPDLTGAVLDVLDDPSVAQVSLEPGASVRPRGDVVQVTGTAGETLSGIDGLGDWNIPWDKWKAGNADEG